MRSSTTRRINAAMAHQLQPSQNRLARLVRGDRFFFHSGALPIATASQWLTVTALLDVIRTHRLDPGGAYTSIVFGGLHGLLLAMASHPEYYFTHRPQIRRALDYYRSHVGDLAELVLETLELSIILHLSMRDVWQLDHRTNVGLMIPASLYIATDLASHLLNFHARPALLTDCIGSVFASLIAGSATLLINNFRPPENPILDEHATAAIMLATGIITFVSKLAFYGISSHARATFDRWLNALFYVGFNAALLSIMAFQEVAEEREGHNFATWIFIFNFVLGSVVGALRGLLHFFHEHPHADEHDHSAEFELTSPGTHSLAERLLFDYDSSDEDEDVLAPAPSSIAGNASNGDEAETATTHASPHSEFGEHWLDYIRPLGAFRRACQHPAPLETNGTSEPASNRWSARFWQQSRSAANQVYAAVTDGSQQIAHAFARNYLS